ncbi:MobV family relaxase [Paraliobacillus ryukyuensis]|uniref:MobV family relaxase n=1 Tax=Paraliobacillus ryukyuensis TaxID=200904 RepID=UPI0009A61D08|nr:MobV family relaxase [Paraliobacillus ryukyuensis]
MSYSILRVSKIKSSVNTVGVQKHVQRENIKYNNKDIDHDKTNENYDLIHGQEKQDYKKLIENRIAEGYKGKRKIRNDAIKHVDGIITSDQDFFKGMDQSKIENFFDDSLKFLEQEYGKQNIIYATVHLDESTPHMHFGVVPLTKDGRLSAKNVVGNKKSLTNLQDRFNDFVNEHGYDLERGESKLVTEKRHRDMDKFKDLTSYHQNLAEKAEKQLLEQEKKLDELADILQPKQVEFSYFEKKTEVAQKLFGKSEVIEKETGNVVLSKEQYKNISEQVNAAHSVIEHYKKLVNTDFYQENLRLQKELVKKHEEFARLTKDINPILTENDKLRKENAMLKDLVRNLQANIKILYQHIKQIFKEKFKDFREIIQTDLNKRKIENHFEEQYQKDIQNKKERDLEM